jgi:ferredoxin/flavodoxin---NADP+ reductase
MTAALKVAIVGAGPAGLYAVDALTTKGAVNARVDVIDRLPAPFGLLRYGVAPDHLKMKSLEIAMQRILERPGVRFFGHVEFGCDVMREDLLGRYDAIIYANGAATDRRLGIPGEDCPGSSSATAFVAWYNGHPVGSLDPRLFEARSVAVIGLGNVALDVARVLAKSADAFTNTDVPQSVLDRLHGSAIRDIYIVGRRSAAYARFTTKELRELGELPDVGVIVDRQNLELDREDLRLAVDDPLVARNLDVLQEWSSRPDRETNRRIHFLFGVHPIAMLGSERIECLRLARSPHGDLPAETTNLAVQWVLRSVGYRGTPLPGVPFDQTTATIPNIGGRVLVGDAPNGREYVTGWARRGPRGVLGTNKSDSAEVVESVLSDVQEPNRSARHHDDLCDLLAARGVHFVDLRGWQRIMAAERGLGSKLGRSRVKLCRTEDLLAAAHTA